MIYNAFNNHIETFTSSSGTPDSCEIAITVSEETYSFIIYPDTDGNFYFNYRPIIEKLINTSNFRDDCDYNVDEIQSDDNACIVANVVKTITYDTESTETIESTFVYVKGLHNLEESSNYYNRGDVFFCHHLNENSEAFLTYFIGYPFDFSFFANAATALNINPEISLAEYLAAYLPTTGYQGSDIDLETDDNGVYRFALSDGDDVSDYITEASKYAVITLNDSIVIKLAIKSPDCGGLYLKWHNQYGGWDYWMFERYYQKSFKDDLVDEVENNFSDLSDTMSPTISAGKELTRTFNMYANSINDYELDRILNVASSPKVYLYSTGHEKKWIEVKVSGSKTYSIQNAKHTIEFEMEIPTKTLQL